MHANQVKVGIVGLGRWAKVLARAARHCDGLTITAAHSRSEDKRHAFQAEFGVPAVPDLATMLADRTIAGVPARSRTDLRSRRWRKPMA